MAYKTMSHFLWLLCDVKILRIIVDFSFLNL